MSAGGYGVIPSVARALRTDEIAQLAATCAGLPSDWCLTVEPPYGQLAISPLRERRRHHRQWVALAGERRITRERLAGPGTLPHFRP